MRLPRLSLDPLSDLPFSPSFQDALAEAPAISLQEYRPRPGTPAGTVRAGWCGPFLCLRADLEKSSPTTRSTGDGQPIWRLGDCFEVFLKRLDTPSYLELHVSPVGHSLQLGFPRLQTRSDQHCGPDALIQRYSLPGKWIESAPSVRPDGSGWTVLARIDLRGLGVAAGDLAGERYAFSFCTCDFTDEDRLYQASSSELKNLDVHLHSQWRQLECAAE